MFSNKGRTLTLIHKEKIIYDANDFLVMNRRNFNGQEESCHEVCR